LNEKLASGHGNALWFGLAPARAAARPVRGRFCFFAGGIPFLLAHANADRAPAQATLSDNR